MGQAIEGFARLLLLIPLVALVALASEQPHVRDATGV
jgi:hypothetical protein